MRAIDAWRMFARITGLSPAEYRARYGPSCAPSTVAFAAARRPAPRG